MNLFRSLLKLASALMFVLLLPVPVLAGPDDVPICARACAANEVCMFVEKDQPARCQAVPLVAPIKGLILPFEKGVEVYCTHSAGIGSHAWSNAYFALDLASAYNQPAAKIVAGADGKAFVYYGDDGNPCKLPNGAPSKADGDSCGNGWGNRVRILHADGYVSFYVHLDKVLMKNGQPVKKGDVIGIEGYTGLAGHRHLHFSVQKLPGVSGTDWESRISWDGTSVPFEMYAVVNGVSQVVNSANFKCAHASVGAAPKELQPRLTRQ